MPPKNIPHWIVPDPDAGSRLDKFLAAPDRIGSRARVSDALRRGRVFLNEVEATHADASTRVMARDVVALWMDRPGSARKLFAPRTTGELKILYEDTEFIVLDKPVGLLAVPLNERRAAPSALDRVEDHMRSHGKRRPFVVHRIDRDTSGLVVFAKTAGAQAALKEQFLRRAPERVYWAIVYGRPTPPSGTWEDRLVWDQRALIQKQTHPSDPKGTDARCEYRVVEQFEIAALIEVRLDTGRRNQIRLQARLHGHTLVGERRYVYGPSVLRPIAFSRQALHAHHLTFQHPTSGETMTFTAPLPDDMRGLLEQLRKAPAAPPATSGADEARTYPAGARER